VDRRGEQRRLAREELRFQYRNFDLEPGFVVTHIGLVLRAGVPSVIRARREDAKRRREAHQPLGYPNAGSIFKNPPGEYAGRLIEAAGLKGLRIGGAMLSLQHANFIVNVGGATAADVRALMRAAEERVWELKRIRLQPEIKLVGDWEP
jgi:UDP-N-acetylmuramate dehydrogenase